MTSGNKRKFLLNLFYKKDTNVILIVLFNFPQRGTKGREVLWDTSHCSHGEINLQMLFYHSIKIHTGVWKKQRSSEWLSWSEYVKYNQVFFPRKNCGSLCSRKPVFHSHMPQNRNLSGGFLWACAHTSVSEELLPWENVSNRGLSTPGKKICTQVHCLSFPSKLLWSGSIPSRQLWKESVVLWKKSCCRIKIFTLCYMRRNSQEEQPSHFSSNP